KPPHCRLQRDDLPELEATFVSALSPMSGAVVDLRARRGKHPTCSGQAQATVGLRQARACGQTEHYSAPNRLAPRTRIERATCPLAGSSTSHWALRSGHGAQGRYTTLHRVELSTKPASVEPRTESEVPGTKQG